MIQTVTKNPQFIYQDGKWQNENWKRNNNVDEAAIWMREKKNCVCTAMNQRTIYEKLFTQMMVAVFCPYFVSELSK